MGLFDNKKKVSKQHKERKLFKTENKQSIFGNKKESTPLFQKKMSLPLVPHKAEGNKTSVQKVVCNGPIKDPLDTLNEDQYEAATLPMGGRSLIIASAGTGKTSTIMGRISTLLKKGITPQEILLLTFTAKAANEMTERIERTLGAFAGENITTGTFHSIGLAIAKKFKRDFVLKANTESALLFKSVYDKRSFIHIHECEKPLSSSGLYEKYSLFVNIHTNEYFGDWVTKGNDKQTPFSDVYSDIADEFMALKQKEKFYDFNDLLAIAREYYSSTKCEYREVIIDEYQDTNPLQSSVIDAMNVESLYCVGDYDQSIYAFIGADISIIGAFQKKYTNANIRTLSKNYRSSRSILNLAEKVIKNNIRLYPKKLEVMTQENQMDPKYITSESEIEQAVKVADKISEEIAKKIDPNEISVIYRSNSSGDVVEVELKLREIPYKRKGGKGFFDSKDIQFILHLYKILIGDTGLIVFLQACDFLGINSGLASNIHKTLLSAGHNSLLAGIMNPSREKVYSSSPIVENTKLGVVNISQTTDKSQLKDIVLNEKWLENPIFNLFEINSPTAKMLSLFFDLVELKESFSSLTPNQLVKKILSSHFYKHAITVYASKYSKNNDGSINKKALTENVETLEKKAAIIQEISIKTKTHKAFISSLITKKKENEEEEEKKVSLLTVHASKGLEFHVVHLVDLVANVFPNEKLMNNGGGGLEEERRLFYVAATRAKQQLFIYAPDRIKSKDCSPSIFAIEAGLI
jgi:DNA helicase-2/ATP-dependent DNA helicase PcrA